MDELARLIRRVEALEANRGSLIRFAKVTEVDEKTGTVRVELPDGEGLITMPARVSQRRTLKDKSQELPDVGEQVITAFLGQGFEQPVVMGAVFSDPDASPGRPAHVYHTVFEDGTEIEYDRKEHKLTANVKGRVDVEATEDINVKTNQNINVDASQTVNIKSAKKLNLQGNDGIALTCPTLFIGGLNDESCDTTAVVNFWHRGQYKHEGEYLHTGDHNQTGSHNLTGDVIAQGSIIDSGGNTNHHSH